MTRCMCSFDDVDHEPTPAVAFKKPGPEATAIDRPSEMCFVLFPCQLDGMIVLFDSQCVLCSRTVRMIIANGRDDSIRFAGTLTAAGRELARRYGLSVADLDETFVVIENGQALLRSDAAIAIAKRLRFPFSMLIALRLVPKRLRDNAYAAVAKRRYRIFGRSDACFVPSPGNRKRFLDLDD